jgi:anti-sigma factor ChrR (cupin superfamily)
MANDPEFLPRALPGLVQQAATPGAVAWQAFRAGVDIATLYQAEDGHSAALLRYQPGASVPRHRHVGYEHILVLSGSQQDERGVYQAGTLVVNPPGSSHAVSSGPGCIVLAIWERPVAFEG